jgi:hypothetical protein
MQAQGHLFYSGRDILGGCMAGIVANYIFAYGFVVDISNPRYFKDSTKRSNMETIKIKRPWKKFINEVGWFRAQYEITLEEQSKLFVFGERILATEDKTLWYQKEDSKHKDIYNVEKDILNATLKHADVIDKEAAVNHTKASFVLFMNDKDHYCS